MLVEFGRTQVLCTASVEDRVPRFLQASHQGWLTAEYAMLPRSTAKRMRREAVMGKQGGRTLEIQRLIGRSLRMALDMKKLGERTITIDCDVIQADGGTRTAAITGGYVALVDAIAKLRADGAIEDNPLIGSVASVSVGLFEGAALLDLNYVEDCHADIDMNVVMDEKGRFIELQGTAEQRPFTHEELDHLLALASQGITILQGLQKKAMCVE